MRRLPDDCAVCGQREQAAVVGNGLHCCGRCALRYEKGGPLTEAAMWVAAGVPTGVEEDRQ